MVQDCGLRFQDRISVLDIRIWRDRKINSYELKNGNDVDDGISYISYNYEKTGKNIKF